MIHKIGFSEIAQTKATLDTARGNNRIVPHAIIRDSVPKGEGTHDEPSGDSVRSLWSPEDVRRKPAVV